MGFLRCAQDFGARPTLSTPAIAGIPLAHAAQAPQLIRANLPTKTGAERLRFLFLLSGNGSPLPEADQPHLTPLIGIAKLQVLLVNVYYWLSLCLLVSSLRCCIIVFLRDRQF